MSPFVIEDRALQVISGRVERVYVHCLFVAIQCIT